MPKTDSVRLRNLYEIINGFNAMYGHDCKLIIGSPSEGHLYFKLDYNIKTSPGAQGRWGSAAVSPLNATNDVENYAMTRIWIQHDNAKPASRPKFILWYDNIYCNPYIMPDYNLAKELGKARVEYFGSQANVLINKEEVYISNKLLKGCIENCEKRIFRCKEIIESTKNTSKNIEQIAEWAGRITDTYEILKLLQLEMQYRTGELSEQEEKYA